MLRGLQMKRVLTLGELVGAKMAHSLEHDMSSPASPPVIEAKVRTVRRTLLALEQLDLS
jgi:hypothetical protein